ncbi:MAG: LacI family transcriptional regulator [Actinomycetota bacterium]|nr:LacI family transcriptional regulator [Actinomycetota bacterium]
MGTIKIIDVAREAGVSTATVSRVLNSHANVDPVLAGRVREAADKLGYRPNGIARSLRRQSTDVIALIISDVGNPFFTAITRGVEDIAQKTGYSVLLCNADEDSSKEATYLAVAEQSQVAGVILSPHQAGTDVSALSRASIPLVVIDRPLSEAMDSVMVHSRDGARAATNHLIDAGWKRPACITGPEEAATAQERLEGYFQAVREHGNLDELYVHAPFRQHGGLEGAARLLDSDNPPDALFVANAQMALGVLQEVKRRNLRIGVDIGIISFDDAPWAQFVSPPMSVVAQPAYDIGAQAAQLLLQRVGGSAPIEPRHIFLSTTLIVRESSRRHSA